MEDVYSLKGKNWLTNSAVDLYIRYASTIIFNYNINFNNNNSYTKKKQIFRIYEKYKGDISIQILTSIEYYIIESKKLEWNYL